jgi:hypothetical protein
MSRVVACLKYVSQGGGGASAIGGSEEGRGAVARSTETDPVEVVRIRSSIEDHVLFSETTFKPNVK